MMSETRSPRTGNCYQVSDDTASGGHRLFPRGRGHIHCERRPWSRGDGGGGGGKPNKVCAKHDDDVADGRTPPSFRRHDSTEQKVACGLQRKRKRKGKWNRSNESVHSEDSSSCSLGNDDLESPTEDKTRNVKSDSFARLIATSQPDENREMSPEQSGLHFTDTAELPSSGTSDQRLCVADTGCMSVITSTPNDGKHVYQNALEGLCESYCPTDTSDSDYEGTIETLSQEFSQEGTDESWATCPLDPDKTRNSSVITPSKPLADMRIVTPRSEKRKRNSYIQSDSQTIPSVWKPRLDLLEDQHCSSLSGVETGDVIPVQTSEMVERINPRSCSYGHNFRRPDENESNSHVLPSSGASVAYHSRMVSPIDMAGPIQVDNYHQDPLLSSSDDRVHVSPIVEISHSPRGNVVRTAPFSDTLPVHHGFFYDELPSQEVSKDDVQSKESLKWLFSQEKNVSIEEDASEMPSQIIDQNLLRTHSIVSVVGNGAHEASSDRRKMYRDGTTAYELPPRFQKMIAMNAKSNSIGRKFQGSRPMDNVTSKEWMKSDLAVSTEERNSACYLDDPPTQRRKPKLKLPGNSSQPITAENPKMIEAKTEQDLTDGDVYESIYKKQWTNNAYERYNHTHKLNDQTTVATPPMGVRSQPWRNPPAPDFLPHFLQKTSPYDYASSSTSCTTSSTLSPFSTNYTRNIPKFTNVTDESNTPDTRFAFLDTHCHIDYLFTRLDYKKTFATFMQEHHFPGNFDGCVAVFCDPDAFYSKMWKDLLKEDKVWGAFGIHPHSSNGYNDAVEARIKEALRHPKAVALGEIGLDYSSHCRCDKVTQHMVFERQLRLAIDLGKPLVIHSRQAEDDTSEILQRVVPRDYKIHRHCFTGTVQQARQILSTFPNSYIGLTALVTYQSATQVHQTAMDIPLNRILLETDAPFFLPQQIKKTDRSLKWSNPGMAIFVAQRIAELRRIPLCDVLTTTRKNAKDMYGV